MAEAMVEFVPVDGGTEVRMLHDLLPTEAFAEDHNKGWTSCLNRLEFMFTARRAPDAIPSGRALPGNGAFHDLLDRAVATRGRNADYGGMA